MEENKKIDKRLVDWKGTTIHNIMRYFYSSFAWGLVLGILYGLGEGLVMGIIFLPILFIVIYYPLGILVSLLTRKIHRVFKLFDILLSPVAMIGDLIHFLVRKRHPGFDFLDGKRFDIFFFTMVVLIAKDNVETNVITT